MVWGLVLWDLKGGTPKNPNPISERDAGNPSHHPKPSVDPLPPVTHHMCLGLNSHYFHIIGDGHQPNSRGLYTHYKDSVIKGGMTIPKKRDF